MSDPDSNTDAVINTPPRSLPGRILRQAREEQGLTLGEVSGALKFTTRQIEALENDDFQQLQGKTFLRGFVRAYARMLKLSPEPLLDMLSDESSQQVKELVVAPANMGETDPVPFYRKHAKVLSFIAVLLLLTLSGIVWFSGLESVADPRPKPVELSSSVPVAASVPPQPVMEVAPPASLPLSGTAPQPTDPAPALVFEFSDRSWLEVRNASGKVLLTGEFPGGQKQTLTDKPPYQIWIGKASVVKVTHDGQVVDLQPYIREEVARFTLE